MEYYRYQPGVRCFMSKNVLYSPATRSNSVGNNTNQFVTSQKAQYSMLLPCKVKSVKNIPSRPVVPYAKYRVVKNSRKTTRSFFVAKVLYHRVMYKQ